MPQTIEHLETLETALFEALDAAAAAGLGSAAGEDAFRRAMPLLDAVLECRAEALHAPLAAHPETRDQVAELDSRLRGLASRIDILRAHITIALETHSQPPRELGGALDRLTRQLRVHFSREAVLIPVYRRWHSDHAAAGA